MWTVVYVASDWEDAERIKDKLAEEGLLVMLRASCPQGRGTPREVELLVPEVEVNEAQIIIMQAVGVLKV